MLIKFELILSYYRMFQVQTLVRPVVLLLILTVFWEIWVIHRPHSSNLKAKWKQESNK